MHVVKFSGKPEMDDIRLPFLLIYSRISFLYLPPYSRPRHSDVLCLQATRCWSVNIMSCAVFYGLAHLCWTMDVQSTSMDVCCQDTIALEYLSCWLPYESYPFLHAARVFESSLNRASISARLTRACISACTEDRVYH